MGSAVAGRLLELGHEVSVWNRTADKVRPLLEAGARAARAPAALASEAEVVITLLTDGAAIAEVFHGPQGLLSGDVKGKLFIEMSTVRPETERDLSAKVRAREAALVECPVGGSTGPAREGKLFGFVGGEDADVARARPLLEKMCRRVEHVGPVGAGASIKLAINLPLFVYWQALGEALSLAKPLGLDPERLISIFSDTSATPNALKQRAAAITGALQGKSPGAVTFDVDSIRKDLRTMLEQARALGVPMPVTEQTLDCFDAAAKDGLGKSDCSEAPAHWVRSHAR